MKILRKYTYIGPDTTMVRLIDWGEKVKVSNGEDFCSQCEKSIFCNGMFKYLWDVSAWTPDVTATVSKPVVAPIVVDDEEEEETKTEIKELRKKYQDKFNKKPFGGWTETELLEKLNA